MLQSPFKDLSFFPESASTIAGEIDLLFLFAVGVTVVFSVLILAVLIFFCFAPLASQLR